MRVLREQQAASQVLPGEDREALAVPKTGALCMRTSRVDAGSPTTCRPFCRRSKKKLSRLRAPFLIFSAARAPSFFSPSSDRPLRRLLSLSLLRHIWVSLHEAHIFNTKRMPGNNTCGSMLRVLITSAQCSLKAASVLGASSFDKFKIAWGNLMATGTKSAAYVLCTDNRTGWLLLLWTSCQK